jgi:hypothetical protein
VSRRTGRGSTRKRTARARSARSGPDRRNGIEIEAGHRRERPEAECPTGSGVPTRAAPEPGSRVPAWAGSGVKSLHLIGPDWRPTRIRSRLGRMSEILLEVLIAAVFLTGMALWLLLIMVVMLIGLLNTVRLLGRSAV